MEKEKIGHRERLRQRFLRGDESAKTEESILELLLTYSIPQKDVRLLARTLLKEFGNLSAVLEADHDKLCQLDGIKTYSAALIKLVAWVRSHYPTKEKQRSPTPVPEAEQKPLFELPAIKRKEISKFPKVERYKVVPRRGTEMFSNAVLKEAIQVLPRLPDTESIDEIRSFLRTNLHFSAEQTRQRYASYITRRMFPKGYADKPLLLFAKAFSETQNLREVCFYRFLKAEPLEIEIVEQLMLPSLGNGRLNRERIRSYLSAKYPNARSVVDCGKAVVDALTASGVAKADRVRITFAYRDILVPAFAFILQSEFPDPGMYDIRKVEENRPIRGMLWNPERLMPSLYELRNLGLISKVSEIDNVRQFTTKYKLGDVVDRLIAAEGRV